MFWGMNLKPNRKYTQTTTKNFHISQASLDAEGLSEDASNKIYINNEDNDKFLICTLRKGACEQTTLDLNFAEGDKICFQSIGTGNVSLTGYLTPNNYLFDDDDDGEEEEEEEEENEEGEENVVANGNASKNKKNQKKPKAAEGSDEDDNDDEEENELLKAALESDDSVESDAEESDAEESDAEESDEDEDEDDEDDDEMAEPKPKMAKIENKESKQLEKQNGIQNAKKSKKEKKIEQQQQQQQKQQKEKPQKQQQQPKNANGAGERSLSGGVKIEDIRVGNGPEVKTGKRAQVYYEGRLKSNNKSFDSVKNGPPFKFNVGRGDVIKAWDVGIVGMKVGGKRRITCPPHMAYGARGSPPAIPPNSTLVFEVELKGVN